MFARFSTDDWCVIALLLDEDEQHRRFGVHPLLRERKKKGEFWTIFHELLDDEWKFFNYFRMTQHDFHILLKKKESSIKKQDTTFKEAIGPKEKLAVCLRFLATGDSFRTIALSYRLGDTTVSKIVIEVFDAIIAHLLAEFIPVPSEEDWFAIETSFWETWNFPNCIGALDGKHVTIMAPANSGSLYFNYKKTFSIVLLALVDAKYRFIAVVVGAYGRNSDGGIFANSKMGRAFAQGKMNVPGDKVLPNTNICAPHVIVADEAFPLKTYLLRPYPRIQLDDAKKQHYNYRHSRARRVSENAVGILAQKFRIYNRRIQLKPEHVDNVVQTTCILHNFIMKTGHSHLPTVEPLRYNLTNLPNTGGNSIQRAFHVRATFKDFFSSNCGRLDWTPE